MDRVTRVVNHIAPSECAVVLAHQEDLSLLDDLLTPEESELRKRVSHFAQEHLHISKIGPLYETATFPYDIVKEFAALKVAGTAMHGYGCPGRNAVSAGVIAMELGRKDAGVATFMSILQTISMVAIYKCGSEKQKQYYLPKMARMEAVGCFGLTEPEAGSDAANLKTTAKKTDKGWVLNGQKRWIGNGTWADIYIIWARDVETKQVLGFIVDKDTPGLSSTKIENKIGLRCVQNADIFMENCIVSEESRLPKSKSFATGPGQCLFLTRLSTAWIACGICLGTLEATLDYVKKRKQFGVPLAKFQIMQERLARMISITQACTMLTWRASVMYDQDKLSLGQVGLCKSHVTAQTRVVVSLAREMYGGNGYITDSLVGKHFVDIEGLHTFEGSYDVNVLIGIRELTECNAIKP